MKNKDLKKIVAIAVVSSSISTFFPRTAYSDNLYNWQAGYYGNGYWQNYSGQWYFYDNNGCMLRGWVFYQGQWYFLDSSGVMQTGLVQIDGRTYLFSDTGAMQTGGAFINGVQYFIDGQGVFYGDNIPQVTKAFDSNGIATMPQNPNQIILNEDSTPSNPSSEAIDPNKKVVIEFRNEDGDTLKSTTVIKGERIVLYEPNKDGYKFDEWSTKKDGEGKTYDALTGFIAEHDMILYENWTKEKDSSKKDKIYVRGIVIKGEDGKDTIKENRGTLQMVATIVPEEAQNKAVTWKIEDGKSKATIDKDGLITALDNGTITVAAVSKSNSSIIGRTTIKITGQVSSNNGGNSGNSGTGGSGDSGNTGNSGNSGNAGNTGNTGGGNGNSGTGNSGTGGSNSGETNTKPLKAVRSIEIISQPKLDYYYNDKLDLSALKVKVHYADNTVTDEIPFEKFAENNISVTNYKNGQNLSYSYVNSNKSIIIKCNDKTINTNEFVMQVPIYTKVVESIKNFDKHVPSDVVFKYTDGNRGEVDSVEVYRGDTKLPDERVKFDKATKTITIPKEYLNTINNGKVDLKINFMDSEGKVLLNKRCSIIITDSEVPAAPTNFIKIEKGSIDNTTKINILSKVSDAEDAEDANYAISDLEYAITNENLEVTTSAAVSATWKKCSLSEQLIVQPNKYFNIRKKAELNKLASNIKSKQITENDIAHISSLKTIKEFKFIDINGNFYKGEIEGNTIKAILDDPNVTTTQIEINKLKTQITFDTTDEEEAKKPTVTIDGEVVDKNAPQTFNFTTSYKKPVKCVVKAEDGSTKTYNLIVYPVKPQETACIMPKVVRETREETVEVTNEKTHETRLEKVIKKVDVNVNYYELYTSSGINLYLDQPGLSRITVRNPLEEAHNPGLNNIVKYNTLGNNYSSQNAEVCLKFNNAPTGAAYVQIASSLEDLGDPEKSLEVIDLKNDRSNAENSQYKMYIPVATRRADSSTGHWEYIYAERAGKKNEYNKYYAWLASDKKTVLGYSKLKISVEENTVASSR